jgi:capsular polysaccharide biosynthesis protein
MNKRVVRRGLDAFFRRWWLYLLPLALFVGVGVATGARSASGYESTGVIDVSKDTLLSKLTDLNGDTFGYETPSASTARTINSLLGTDQFMESVVKGAGVTGAVRSGQLNMLGLRQALAVSTDGDTLVQVAATTDNPELSAKLAGATIDSFIQYVDDGDVSESKAAEAFFNSQLQSYKDAVERAQQVLSDYAAKHPGGPQEQRPLAEQVEIQQLTSAVTQAQSQLTNAQQKSEEARLATEQATTNASQRLRIIDQPKASFVPVPRLKKAVISLVIFIFVGLMLTIAAVVLGTVLDRSLRTADDVEALLHLPVLAVVPNASTKRRSKRAAKKAARHGDASPQAASAPSTERVDGRATVVAGGGNRNGDPGRRTQKVSATSARRTEARPATDELDTLDGDPALESAHVERIR